MRTEDRAEFLRIMNGIAAVYGSTLTPEALEVWWRSFGGWSIEDFRNGCGAVVTRCKFMPRPADLFDLKRASRPTAGEAWEIAGCGKDALADRALAIATQGRYFGHIQFDEHQWIQKRFLEVYEQLADVEAAREAAPQLAAPEWEKPTNRVPKITYRNADGKTVNAYGEPAVTHEEARENLARLKHLMDS